MAKKFPTANFGKWRVDSEGFVRAPEVDRFNNSLDLWANEVEHYMDAVFSGDEAIDGLNIDGDPAIMINGRVGYLMTGLVTARQVGVTGNVAVAPAWTTCVTTNATLKFGDWVKIELVLDSESIGAGVGDFIVSTVAINGVANAAGGQSVVMQAPGATGRWGNMSQNYWYFAPSDNTYTFAVFMQRSGGVGTIRSDDHTTITLTVFSRY